MIMCVYSQRLSLQRNVIEHNLIYLKIMHDLLGLMNAILQVFFHLDMCYSAVLLRTIWSFTLITYDIPYNF